MQKKKSEPGGSQIKDLLDATEERKTRNPERSQSERRENKNNNSFVSNSITLITELKILFYFSPLLHEYSKSPHSGCLRIQKDDTLPACVLRIRCLTLRLSKILKNKFDRCTDRAGSNPPGATRDKKIKKPYSTWDSLVVPYQSTDQAQRCLTSQFGWDAVLSPWYDRMTRALRKSCTSLFIFWKNKNSNFFNFYFFNFLFFRIFIFSKKFEFLFFQHFGGLDIVGPLFHISSIRYQMLGCDYLNSIRKSWLVERRFEAI